MKRIIISLSVVAAVAAAVVVGTTAFFSDTETSTGNVISAGTLDISTGGTLVPVRLEDLKPSYVRFIEFDVTNSGNNPLRLWKHIKNIQTDENGTNEPEQQWYTEHNGGDPKNDIDTVIEYDMYIGGQIVWDDEAKTTGHVEEGSVVIDERDGITLADIESHYIYIGELKSQETKHIIQSYHMASDTENWAQSDTLTFDIELLALQLNAPGPVNTTLLLENKNPQTWDRITGDGRYGILTYKTENNTFDYTFEGRGLQATTNYSLIYYADPWAGNHPGALIGTMDTNASGNVSTTGTVNLAMDLPDPADANYANGAKIWLVPSSDYNSSTKSMAKWIPENYLFEYNLVKYEDTDN